MLLLVGGGIMVRIMFHSFLAMIIFALTVWTAAQLYRAVAPSVGIPQSTLYEATRDGVQSVSKGAERLMHPPTPTLEPTRTPAPTPTGTPTVTLTPAPAGTVTRVPTSASLSPSE